MAVGLVRQVSFYVVGGSGDLSGWANLFVDRNWGGNELVADSVRGRAGECSPENLLGIDVFHDVCIL